MFSKIVENQTSIPTFELLLKIHNMRFALQTYFSIVEIIED
jgi:hypothetical protein